MALDVRNELAEKEIAVAHAAVGGIDVEAAFSFRRYYQEIVDLFLLAQVFDESPSAGLEQSLFVVAEAVEEIEDGITPWRMRRDCGVVAGREHHAVVDGLAKDAAFNRVAIDAALGVG